MTKQIEKLLMVVLVLTVVSMLLAVMSPFLLVRLFSTKAIIEVTQLQKAVALFFVLPRMLVGLCVAFWLMNAAKKCGANQYAWFVLGLFLGVMALVVFYLVRIYEMLEATVRGDKHHDGSPAGP